MENKTGIFVLGGLIILVILAILFAKPRVSWSYTLNYESDQPYGTKFVHELLKSKYTEDNFELLSKPFDTVYNHLDSNVVYDYIKIDKRRYYDSSEVSSLLNFVDRGNNAFISIYDASELLDTLLLNSCREWSLYKYYDGFDFESVKNNEDLSDIFKDDFLDSSIVSDNDTTMDDGYYYEYDEETDSEVLKRKGYWRKNYVQKRYDSVAVLNFDEVEHCREDSSFNFFYFYKHDTSSFTWSTYYEHCLVNSLDGLEPKILGRTDSSNVNFFAIPFGDGSFYFHSMPIVFTNVEVLIEDRLLYVEKSLSYLQGDKMLWDLYETREIWPSWNNSGADQPTPLSYLLSEIALRWAIYLSVIAGLLFLLFRAKRKQQYIPVIEPNNNTSVEFSEMMGQLYFEKKNHHFVAGEIWKKFLDYVRVHYYLFPKEGDESWIKKLSEKSTVTEQKLRGILRAYEKTKFEDLKEDELTNFYQKLNYFYKEAK